MVEDEDNTAFATLVFAVVVWVPLGGTGSTMVTARPPPFALVGDVAWPLVAVGFEGVAVEDGGTGNKELESALISATAAAIAGGRGGTWRSTISSSGGSCSDAGVWEDLRPETVRGNAAGGAPDAEEDTEEDEGFFLDVLPIVAVVAFL